MEDGKKSCTYRYYNRVIEKNIQNVRVVDFFYCLRNCFLTGYLPREPAAAKKFFIKRVTFSSKEYDAFISILEKVNLVGYEDAKIRDGKMLIKLVVKEGADLIIEECRRLNLK